MKKLKKQNHTKVALFAGATALMALTTNNVPGNPNPCPARYGRPYVEILTRM